jgi:hypothetical protein
MRCRTCPKVVRQIEQRHSWIHSRQCAKCHFLGMVRPYNNIHCKKKREEREKLKQ